MDINTEINNTIEEVLEEKNDSATLTRKKTGKVGRYETIQNIKEDLMHIKEKSYKSVTYPNIQKLIALGYITSEKVVVEVKQRGRPKMAYNLTEAAEIFISK